MHRCNRAAWLASSAASLGVLAVRGVASAQFGPPINVGAGLIESHAEGYYASEMGFFKQRGLNVQLHTLRNGAAIAAAVTGGDLQIGCSTVLQLAQAHARGIPYVIIVPGGVHDGRFVHTASIVVAADSSIASAKELSGKIVAASTLNGLDQLSTSALIDQSGGDSSTTKFVEIPPSAMVEALAQGRVVAASLEEPELSAAGNRVRRVGDGLDAIAKVFVTTAWFTTNDWLAKNKDTARRFSDAIFAAGTWAMANPEKAATVLAKYLSFKEPRSIQPFATKRDFGAMTALMTTAAKYRFIAAVSPTDLIWDGK
ncbi:MAG TPA: ABC transporter substrate-binding protein [Candidatus Binatia bacterium]|nr:ABC transporter substrate-binding protein [Candidatus Binatia bacterium]